MEVPKERVEKKECKRLWRTQLTTAERQMLSLNSIYDLDLQTTCVKEWEL